MADKMARVAGRTSGGVAVPMLADANGNIGTTRVWKRNWVEIQSALEIRDTDEHNIPAFDVRNISMFSLRIINRLGVPITIEFKTDVNTTNGYLLADTEATEIAITVQPTNHYVIITPEELPILNYVQYVRMNVKASSAPASGVFEAYAVTVG